MKKHLVVILIFLQNLVVFAQEPVYTHYSVDDGLPSNEVYQAMQDSKGYIWFATDNGVSRFNGYEFENFTSENGLAGNTIFYMYEDFKQRIWFVSFSKQLSYFENDSIYRYPYNYLIEEALLKRNMILTTSFYVDSLENIYFGTFEQGAFKIDKEGRLENDLDTGYVQVELLGNNTITSVSGLRSKPISYRLKLKKTNKSLVDTEPISVSNQQLYSLLLDVGKVLIANYSEILIIEDSKLLKRYKYNYFFHWIGKDSENNLWISKDGGGVICYKNLNLDSEPINYLEDKTVLSAYTDKEKNVWITTTDGVYYYPNIGLKHIGSKLFSNSKINHVELGKEKELWWSSGADIFQMQGDAIMKYRGEERRTVIRHLDYDKSQNRLLFSGRDVLGYIGNNFRKELSNYTIIEDSGQENYYKELLGFSQAHLLNDSMVMALGARLSKINLYTSNLYDLSLDSPIQHSRFNCFYSQSDSTFLIGTLHGLWRCSNERFTFLGEINDLLKFRINDITQDNQGNLWLAAKGNGIIVHNNDTTIQITKKEGLSSNAATSIFMDGDMVWVGTMNGLNKIKVEDVFRGQYHIEKIYKYHGLASNVVNDVSTNGKTVYIGTDNGLCYFNKSEFIFNTNEVPVYFTNVSILEKDTILQDTYDLSYSRNTLSIAFIGLNYRNSKNIQYRYRLLGVENDWIETSNRQVRYPALNPGEYQFELLAMNENGLWNTEAKVIRFVIHKPYWQTWWFYVLSLLVPALIASFIVYLFFRMRLRENKKRTILHQNLARLRQEALAQQMNPHFIFNTLSSIQYYINENDKNASNKYLTMFARLMRMTLDNSYQKNISIQEELNALEIYIKLEQLRFDDKFTYTIKVEEGFDPNHYMMPALLFQPFVENAIWHGIMHKQDKSGHINIHLSKFGDTVQCVIIDNGIGRKKSSEINKNRNKTHKSLGAKITESRLQLINTSYLDQLHVEYIDLEDRDGQSEGTKVLISLPINMKMR